MERFWAKVDRASGDCWIWTGGKDNNGYGTFKVSRERGVVRAHVFAKELSTGQLVPSGMLVLHHCDVPACVNPDHTYVGTRQDNARDRWARNPGVRKLSDADVQTIRTSGGTQTAAAARFGVSVSYACMLRHPERYNKRRVKVGENQKETT